MSGAIRQAELLGNGSEAVTAGPAHGGRMGMDALAPAIFPDAVVRFERELARLGAQHFEQSKQSFIARAREPAVVEHGHGREDDAAVGVVLNLLSGRVADAHRSVAAIAFER